MPEKFFFIEDSAVRAAIHRIRETRIHPHFQGYLATRRINVLEQRAATNSDIAQYYDRYLRVGDPLPKKPYLQMFWDKEFSADSLFFNPNVAGSYSLSSLRPKSPFVACLREFAMPYELRDGHSAIALQSFCGGVKISAHAVATALIRDFGFKQAPTDETILDAFREELGFTANDSDFQTLFEANDAFSIETA